MTIHGNNASSDYYDADDSDNDDDNTNNKQLLDEVFVISRIIKVEVSVISRSRRPRLITLTETLIIPDITKTSSNNCLISCSTSSNNCLLITLHDNKM